MPSAARSAVTPLYLLACLILGGSAQGIWQNAALQMMGLAIIAWAVIAPPAEPVSTPARRLLLIVAAGMAAVAIQAIPLPPSVWAHGAREQIAEGYRVLGIPAPWLPIAVSPYGSLSTLLCLIPPLALFIAMVRQHAYRPSWLAAALLAGTVAGILLGVLQVTDADTSARWYLYPQTNIGKAVGFFANPSHMGMLLIVSTPFVAAIAAAGRSRNIQHYSALIALLVALALLVIVGVALNGSLAGFLLIGPVIGMSSLFFMDRRSKLRQPIAVLAVLGVIAAVGVIALNSSGAALINRNAGVSVQSRAEIVATTAQATVDFLPWGSGLGSFAKVYRLYENPDVVTNEYVVHAHNDYLELVLELGVAGGILIVLFLGWYANEVWKLWRRSTVSPFAYAASIASAALLLHSLVEFPLRTAAMSATFAMCLALISDRRPPLRQEAGDLRPARHIVIR